MYFLMQTSILYFYFIHYNFPFPHLSSPYRLPSFSASFTISFLFSLYFSWPLLLPPLSILLLHFPLLGCVCECVVLPPVTLFALRFIFLAGVTKEDETCSCSHVSCLPCLCFLHVHRGGSWCGGDEGSGHGRKEMGRRVVGGRERVFFSPLLFPS